MFNQMSDGSLDVWGTATRDAEYKTVGEKHTSLASFSLAVGKAKDTTTIFCNCKAWNRLARYSSCIRKGDSVRCIGKVEEREYNGKTYKDLICEWIGVAATRSGAAPEHSTTNQEPAAVTESSPQQPDQSAFEFTDDDCPF